MLTTKETSFQIGKALKLWTSDAPKLAILSTGSLGYTALLAARALAEKGVESIVLHVPTIKPLDEAAVLDAAKHAAASSPSKNIRPLVDSVALSLNSFPSITPFLLKDSACKTNSANQALPKSSSRTTASTPFI